MKNCVKIILPAVNGLLVAESEVVRFHEEDGMIFTIYNENMDFYFYILVHGSFVNIWKNIYVNEFYSITNLKMGLLETISGKKRILLKTTPVSTYAKINSFDIKKFQISTRLKELISVPGICAVRETINEEESTLISYEGTVTGIRSSYGVYELDNKVIIYATYNMLRSIMPTIGLGSKLFISNVHLLTTSKGRPTLVCCGLTSIKIVASSSIQEECNFPEDSFVLKYSLSIYDLLWLEELFESLKRKFCSIISIENMSIEKDMELLENILNFFHCSKEAEDYDKSFIEEYCSFPHKCLPLLKDQISTACFVHNISYILREASSHITWIELSRQWCISFSPRSSSVLVGILYFSENGYLYIEDETCNLQIILTEVCSRCSNEKNMLYKFKSCDVAFMVAIQDYCIIFENILFKTNIHSLRYLKTSCCCIFPLADFHKHQLSNHNSLSRTSYQGSVNTEKVSYRSFKNRHDIELSSYSKNIPTQEIIQGIDHYFLVLCKIWSINGESSVCSKVVGLFLPQAELDKEENRSFFNNTFNFYETEDDIEFANLISEMNCLSIENKPRLLCLCIENVMEYNFLISGYIYNIQSENFIMPNSASKSMDSNSSILFVRLRKDMTILFNSKCWSNNYLNAVKYCGIKEILLKKHVSQNCFVRAMLVDKFCEESVKSSKQNETERKFPTTLCLLLRDIDSKDTLYAYVPLSPNSIVGLLPGAILDLYGFFCISSQKGYLYLKASLLFGIEVKYFALQNESSYIRSSAENLNNTAEGICERQEINSISSSCLNSLKCLCFILKVVSAELSLVCTKCLKYVEEACICSATYKIKTQISVLIDDGNRQLVCFAKDDEARKVLLLEKSEWQSLVSHVHLTQKSIKYTDKKTLAETAFLPIINQVFCTYCCSKLICRQMLIEFHVFPNPGSMTDDLYYAWCVNASNVSVKDCMMELYVKMKKFPPSVS